ALELETLLHGKIQRKQRHLVNMGETVEHRQQAQRAEFVVRVGHFHSRRSGRFTLKPPAENNRAARLAQPGPAVRTHRRAAGPCLPSELTAPNAHSPDQKDRKSTRLNSS